MTRNGGHIWQMVKYEHGPSIFQIKFVMLGVHNVTKNGLKRVTKNRRVFREGLPGFLSSEVDE